MSRSLVFVNKSDGRFVYIQTGRYANFRNAVHKMTQYIKYNFKKRYSVLVTLTLEEATMTPDEKDFHRVINFIKQRLLRAGADSKYIRVGEIQKKRLRIRGEKAIHYHILFCYDKPYVFPSAYDIAQSWRGGRYVGNNYVSGVDISAPKRLQIHKRDKVMNYISKYIGKDGYCFDELEKRKAFTASQVGSIYKLSEKRLAFIDTFYKKELWEKFKATYTKVWLEMYGDKLMIKKFYSEWQFLGYEEFDVPF